jgi:hypothetical protein
MRMVYYVGILPEDRGKLKATIEFLNENPNFRWQVKVLSEFDDPDGYYTFQIEGTGESYKHLLQLATNEGFIKSLNHYEE